MGNYKLKRICSPCSPSKDYRDLLPVPPISLRSVSSSLLPSLQLTMASRTVSSEDRELARKNSPLPPLTSLPLTLSSSRWLTTARDSLETAPVMSPASRLMCPRPSMTSTAASSTALITPSDVPLTSRRPPRTSSWLSRTWPTPPTTAQSPPYLPSSSPDLIPHFNIQYI